MSESESKPVSECLCLVSESALEVSESESKPASECLCLVSESALKVSELMSKSVSECPSLVSKLPLTWLPSGLFIVIYCCPVKKEMA